MSTYQESNEFYHCIDELIKTNLVFREKSRPQFKHISPLHWLCDFCTIAIDMGTGKNEYIRRRATKDDLVITFNANGIKGNQYKVIPVDYSLLCIELQKEYKHIYIDEPSLVFKVVDLNKILSFYGERETTIVLLG